MFKSKIEEELSSPKKEKTIFKNKNKILKLNHDDIQKEKEKEEDDDDADQIVTTDLYDNNILYNNITEENIKKVYDNKSIYKDKNITLSYHRKIFSYHHIRNKYYKFKICNQENNSYCNIYLYFNNFKFNLKPLYNKINNIVLYLNIKMEDNDDLYYETLKIKLGYTFKYSLINDNDEKEYKTGKILLNIDENKKFNEFIHEIYSIEKKCSVCNKKIKIIYKCNVCNKSYLCLDCKNNIVLCKGCKKYRDDFFKKSYFFRDEKLKNRKLQRINNLLNIKGLQEIEIKKIKMNIENISKIEYYNILCNEVKNINDIINRVNEKIKEKFF
jgi:hypothetical protein